ncbi:MAG TPA: VOC family protein [Gemmatimonadales bacterium]|jgi:lactoylglutathione lyase|nr:VOC family protein [Gemmatimonadales bacterium]
MSNSASEQLQGLSLEASFTVKNLEQSAKWYAEVLGFSEDRRYEREGRVIAVSLKAGTVRILLTQDDGAKGLDRAKGIGLSLQITTNQSADALAERVKSHGGTLDTEPTTMMHGARVFRLRDPDGFRFTISSTHAA